MRANGAQPRATIDLDGGDKTIFVISPQPWDGFRVSKHHYASMLAERGHRVFFFNPPRLDGPSGRIAIAPTDIAGVNQVSYRTFFPYGLKFRFRPVFDRLMRVQARRLMRATGVTPDIVWDFDNAFQYADLAAFGAKLAIFHPVDSLPAAGGHKNADVVLSVSPLFVARTGIAPEHGHVIPHGLGPDYAAYGRQRLEDGDSIAPDTRRPRVGYVGNLNHVGVDWPTLLAVIRENPGIDFVFYGPYSAPAVPVEDLRACPNCDLRGARPAREILREAGGFDAWLICYDRALTADGAINSHKILEYLATGKTIIANRIDSYDGSPLVAMCRDERNRDYPALFRSVMASLDVWNAAAKRRARISFALEHEYSRHLGTIAQILRGAQVQTMPGPEMLAPAKPGRDDVVADALRPAQRADAARLAIVVSHPIQHFVHFYRAIAREPDIALKVFFCARIGVDDYFDREMNVSITWKTDLLSGYDHEFLPEAAGIRSSAMRAVNNPSVGARLEAFAPDAVLVYGYSTVTALRTIAWCRARGIPLLMMGDTDNVTRRSPAKALARRAVLGPLLAQMRGFLTVGDGNEAALRTLGVPTRKMFRSPFTIDEGVYLTQRADRAAIRAGLRARFGIPDDAFVLLSVGKLSPRKRPLDLIDAAARLAGTNGPPIHILICGNGELFETMRARVDAERLPVTLAGFVNVDELPKFYAAADALVHASAYDPHPLVCSEGAATGLPLLLSDKVGAVGPTDIARDGQNALVFPCGDVAALAAAMKRLCDEPALLAAMVDASLRIFGECDMRASVAGLQAALRSCLMKSEPAKRKGLSWN